MYMHMHKRETKPPVQMTNDIQEKGLATQGPGAVKVATVDSFQGAEREVIVYSCVRTTGLGFLDSPHRCVFFGGGG